MAGAAAKYLLSNYPPVLESSPGTERDVCPLMQRTLPICLLQPEPVGTDKRAQLNAPGAGRQLCPFPPLTPQPAEKVMESADPAQAQWGWGQPGAQPPLLWAVPGASCLGLPEQRPAWLVLGLPQNLGRPWAPPASWAALGSATAAAEVPEVPESHGIHHLCERLTAFPTSCVFTRERHAAGTGCHVDSSSCTYTPFWVPGDHYQGQQLREQVAPQSADGQERPMKAKPWSNPLVLCQVLTTCLGGDLPSPHSKQQLLPPP